MSIKFATWGALLFITDNINWKPRPTLDVKKENEPDSSFIEIFQKRFQLYYIKTLTERFTREKNKEVIPLSIPTDAIIYSKKFEFENPAIMKDKQCKQMVRFSVMTKGSDYFLSLDDKS